MSGSYLTVHRCAGQLGNITRRADVIRMEVGDKDACHPAIELRELRGPTLLRVGEPETRVDERPPVVPREQIAMDVSRASRKGQCHAVHSVAERLHRLRLSPHPTLISVIRNCHA